MIRKMAFGRTSTQAIHIHSCVLCLEHLVVRASSHHGRDVGMTVGIKSPVTQWSRSRYAPVTTATAPTVTAEKLLDTSPLTFAIPPRSREPCGPPPQYCTTALVSTGPWQIIELNAVQYSTVVQHNTLCKSLTSSIFGSCVLCPAYLLRMPCRSSHLSLLAHAYHPQILFPARVFTTVQVPLLSLYQVECFLVLPLRSILSTLTI